VWNEFEIDEVIVHYLRRPCAGHYKCLPLSVRQWLLNEDLIEKTKLTQIGKINRTLESGLFSQD